jgi:hypothetical protein
MKTLHPLLLGAALLLLPCSAGADTVSPAVASQLLKAETALKSQSYAAALADVNRAATTAGLSAYDHQVIAELRAAAAGGVGQYGLAAQSYAEALNGPDVPADMRVALLQSISGLYARAGDNAQTSAYVAKYIAAGGTDATIRALATQADYNEGNYAAVGKDVKRDGATASPAELELAVLAAQKLGDQQGSFEALQAVLRVAPSAGYWSEAIALVQNQPGFPDTLTIDAYRLRQKTGTLTVAGDIEDYAERAILDGKPSEAKTALDAGFANGVLNEQTDNGHAERLRTLANDTRPPAAPLRAATPLEAAITSGGGFAAVPGYAQGQLADPEAALARLFAIADGATP